MAQQLGMRLFSLAIAKSRGFCNKQRMRLIPTFVCCCLLATLSACKSVRCDDTRGLHRSSTGSEGEVHFDEVVTGDRYWEAFKESYYRGKEGFPPPSRPSRGSVGQVIYLSDPGFQGSRDGARAAAFDQFRK